MSLRLVLTIFRPEHSWMRPPICVNAKILCFNVDTLFNYSLDALILLRILDYPKSEILAMSKDMTNVAEREAILNRFGYSLKN